MSDCSSARSGCGRAAADPGALPRGRRAGGRRRGARATLKQCATPPAVFENPTYESAGARCVAVHLLLAEKPSHLIDRASTRSYEVTGSEASQQHQNGMQKLWLVRHIMSVR